MRHWPVIAFGVLGVAACSLDWNALDPRSVDGAGGAGPSSVAETTTSGAGGAAATTTSSTTTTVGVGGGGGMAGTGGMGMGGGGGAPFFVDDFNRPDGTIGNGWIEKAANVFSLTNGVVTKVETMNSSYRDNMVYRPPVEDILDVEASVEFETLTTNVAFPQMFVRVQQSTVQTPSEYDGYLFYVAGSATMARLGRQIGAPFVTTLETITISPGLEPGKTYRLRLSAEGTSPVHLEAYVEEKSGNGWIVIGQAMHDDSASTRVDGAGAVGFAGNEPDTFVFDNFAYRPLP